MYIEQEKLNIEFLVSKVDLDPFFLFFFEGGTRLVKRELF